MANQSLPEKSDDLDLAERAAFLSSAPRSGQLSPIAHVFAAQAFIWLCSIVVFGSMADFAENSGGSCQSICKTNIAIGVLSFFFTSVLLVLQYLNWSNKISQSSWFSPTSFNMRALITLIAWWTIGVSTLSAVRIPAQATGLATFFGWLAFFACIFGAYKAYHSSKEEQRSLHYAQIMSMQATEEEEYANFS